jgi:hypothetical protein
MRTLSADAPFPKSKKRAHVELKFDLHQNENETPLLVGHDADFNIGL